MSAETEKTCLGCAGDVPAEFIWHDGLYLSYVCADHAKKQLPRRDRDDYRESKLEHGGRERIVSGYATRIDGDGEKIVWADEVGQAGDAQ